MLLKAFDAILTNPEKIAYFKQDPVLLATFNAMHAYVKNGHSFSELPWFALAQSNKKVQTKKLSLKKAA